jgi:DNA-binding IscR family transcriptional regulator
MGNEPGIKAKVRAVLESAEAPLSMGQIMATGDIAKTSAADVSSALHKLRGAGLVKTTRGPSSSPRGPKFVKLYAWLKKPTVAAVVRRVESPMAGLGVFRI